MGDANQAPENDAPAFPPDNGQYELNDFGETVMYFSQPEEDTEQSPQSSRGEPSSAANSSGDADSADLPAKIDKYEIQGLLGRGAYGAVYLGFDAQLDRQVAIKVPLLNTDAKTDELLVSEARQLAKLKHPNIVTIFDVGVHDGNCFIVADYLQGKDLNRWIAERTLTWRESALMVASIADGLAEAHAQNTIHRDIKPANIIVMERAEGFTPVLVDFGLALSSASGGRRGEIVGTPNYMSPEQAQGEGHRIDGRTDIYALGVILYKMLSGELPFRAAKITDLLRQIIDEEPRPPRQFVHGIPEQLERICLKAMAKSVTERYTTAGDIAKELRQLVRETEAATTAPSKPKPKPQVPKSGIRMLIADDHELTRFKLQSDLEKWGHEVVAAEDGEQAFELFQQEKFSLVITDWMMPNVDGLQLVQKIRATKTDEYVYVIMLTAKAEKHDIVVGMGAGADDFLAKPFHRDELNVRLRAGIRITKLNRELTETNRRISRSLEAVIRMRQSCLPSSLPDAPGFKFAWEHKPSDDLGGDLLNVVQLDDRQLGLYVLDVKGQGMPASLLATSIGRVMSPSLDANSVLVEQDGSSMPRVLEPFEVARKLNEQFAWAGRDGQFFSLVYGVLDTHDGELRYVSAGHPPLIHQRANGTPEVVGTSGMPIGMIADSDYEQDSLTLEPGDRLVMYSDGLTDTPNASDELFGSARVLDSLTRLARLTLNESIRGLLSDLGKWRGKVAATDDVSLLAVEVAAGR
ncbi:MAG: SpoIIE family protein phosphatase [Planctomycetota bacterium]|nr:SpoIIE family protein phosphatase [Planctomycetota bacterium]